MTTLSIVRRGMRMILVDVIETGDVVYVDAASIPALVHEGYISPPILRAVCELEGCDHVFVVVPTGAGDKRFCSQTCASRYANECPAVAARARGERQAMVRALYPPAVR